MVIVTHNSADHIVGCLDSIAADSRSAARCSVYVVDNGSSDQTVALAGAHPIDPTIISQENLGYAAGVNAGIAAAGPEHGDVLVLNPDVRLIGNALERLCMALESPGAGIAVPRMVDGEGQLLFTLRREPTAMRAIGEALLGGRRAARFPRLSEVVTDPSSYEGPTVADWSTGAAMLISSSCVRAVGDWDERYFLYGEETDFALRARDLGFALRLVPDASVIHYGGESNVSPRLWSILTVNRVRLHRRRRGLLRSVPFAFGVALNESIRALQGRPTARAALGALIKPGRIDPSLERARKSHPDYVLFAGLDWWYHNQAHSDFQIFRRISKTRDVLVVNSIGTRMPLPGRTAGVGGRILRKLKSVMRFLRKPISGVYGFNVITPLSFPVYGHRQLRQLNALLVSVQVRVAALLTGVTKPVVVATLPSAVDVIDRLPSSCVVYNRSDKHSEFAEVDRDLIAGMEERLLREADLVLYVSRVLMEEDRPFAEGRQIFLDHGVDLDHFDPARFTDEPPEMRSIPRPRVGFFGGLDDFLVDFDLIRQIARELPDAQVVLVGGQGCSDAEIEAMLRLPNLTWLGYRPYEDIPALGAAFDVAIMPWQDNDWIHRCNPIKLKEYLALGLPIVSTSFPELARYEHLVSVANSPDDFVARVASAIADGGPGSPEERRAAVLDASWNRRAATFMSAVESLVQR